MLPKAQGLYRPEDEHDACGVAFVAHIKGQRSHKLVQDALLALRNLEHRGASGAEADTGDGAGILLQMPDLFLRQHVPLPTAGSYGAGLFFLPRDADLQRQVMQLCQQVVSGSGGQIIAWRNVPADLRGTGHTAAAHAPVFKQLFVTVDAATDLERRLYLIRRRLENAVAALALPATQSFYIVSLSSQTLIYKGMLTALQLPQVFTDLHDPLMQSALALVHQRFSTNTFPSWPLAHPYRYVAHNGEINTLRGNVNWMRAREGLCASAVFGAQLADLFPVIGQGGSDTAAFDNVLEFLVMNGRSLPHAMLMMIPEPWAADDAMPATRRAFYEYHAALMEPWDGPAVMTFTDGTCVGAVLDRNGLRPCRYTISRDDVVVMASEAGVLDIAAADIVHSGRLQPGRIFLVDTAAGRLVGDAEIKDQLAADQPYQTWLTANMLTLDTLPNAPYLPPPDHATVQRRQQAFGYTHEDLRLILAPMAQTGEEPTGSMGTDTALAVLSTRPRLLYDYFKQLFAQVTNPPLDAIREHMVTSMESTIGPEGNLLQPTAQSCRQINITYPIMDNEGLAKLRHINEAGFKTMTLPMLYACQDGATGLSTALDALMHDAAAAVADGHNIVILSDRGIEPGRAAIPSLLATAAVHHHLVRLGSRTRCALVLESGDAREVHHMALSIGYGAGAVNPYLAFESIDDMLHAGLLKEVTRAAAIQNYINALNKGILKVMSKMGISTLQSYCGAQIFEAVGLAADCVDRYFTGTATRLGGIGLESIAADVQTRHHTAYPTHRQDAAELPWGGEYQWRRDGEYHLFNPETVFKLQHATRSKQYSVFKEYSQRVNAQSVQRATLRGLLTFKNAVTPLPLSEVEPAAQIIRRFATGAMSYGSISAEAHETLAIAMNRLGGKSNTGEGGEDAARNVADDTGDLRRSAIKQVASARFGVTSEYLVNADDIQIKIAQGAKPGEGGQLPGSKVYPWIAKVRHATPGVGLISPPPHHDIYSIEDLAQLIYDLKNANPQARIQVKLVSEGGVGTVAAGVVKAHADGVLISGFDGGTGAAPLTSIKHGGTPWELGLAETQQVLLLNGLRDRVVVQVDGQMKTGRDVVIAALLGAEEFGFATAPLVVSGCVMMRVCHLNTCPVGIATQDPQLRQLFSGKPEFVENFFHFIAEEVREIMAELGFRTMDEMVGQVERLQPYNDIVQAKAAQLDLTALLYCPPLPVGAARRARKPQDHGLAKALDNTLIEQAADALLHGRPVVLHTQVRNVHRAVGTLLGHAVTRRYGSTGLADDTIAVHCRGTAGQSMGAFVPRGITLTLCGQANDYFGKGLSGGRLIAFPSPDAQFVAAHNVIIGNVALYGATAGEAFICGMAGERFAVRNSGAHAVVEGLGDHGCEYMTGGRVVVLGRVGRNFAAGMSGGIAYLVDCDSACINHDMVAVEPPDSSELRWLRDFITRHKLCTHSALAADLLRDWTMTRQRIRRVMPKDYKRALAAQPLQGGLHG